MCTASSHFLLEYRAAATNLLSDTTQDAGRHISTQCTHARLQQRFLLDGAAQLDEGVHNIREHRHCSNLQRQTSTEAAGAIWLIPSRTMLKLELFVIVIVHVSQSRTVSLIA